MNSECVVLGEKVRGKLYKGCCCIFEMQTYFVTNGRAIPTFLRRESGMGQQCLARASSAAKVIYASPLEPRMYYQTH